jgi:hypothetical protein
MYLRFGVDVYVLSIVDVLAVNPVTIVGSANVVEPSFLTNICHSLVAGL